MRKALLACCFLLGLGACARVSAVHRQTLGKATLREPTWPLAARQEQHVWETREGTRGAGMPGGGGCGCN